MTAVEYKSTVYPDVTKVWYKEKQIATICGNPKTHRHFQVVTHLTPGKEFREGFRAYAEAQAWVSDHAPDLHAKQLLTNG